MHATVLLSLDQESNLELPRGLSVQSRASQQGMTLGWEFYLLLNTKISSESQPMDRQPCSLVKLCCHHLGILYNFILYKILLYKQGMTGDLIY